MRQIKALATLLVITTIACATSPAPTAKDISSAQRRAQTGMDFLDSVLKPWPEENSPTKLAVVTPGEKRVAIYDNALVALAFDRVGRHDDAGRILEALADMQHDDGAIAFSFQIDQAEDAPRYVRSGALAWVGYAAAEYLDISAGGPARDKIVRSAHLAARYLMTHQIASPNDPRDGLVTGGEGDLVYTMEDGELIEDFTPSKIEWASVEHNIDAYFFLKKLSDVTAHAEYRAAADRIHDALLKRAWNADAGEFRRGLSAKGNDKFLALDCASWGSLFLTAANDPQRAEIAFKTADSRFASHDPKTGVVGHRPYASGAVIEDEAVAAHYDASQVPKDWSSLEAVWPEGSAGVALAAARTGHRDRAAAILIEIEKLRTEGGGLPMMTAEVPFELDTKPSVAATAWVELITSEIEKKDAPFLWKP
jgi:hypothetical protein